MLVRTNGMIGGVCGGISQFLGIDPIILRLILCLLSFFTNFPIIIIYIIFWVIMPEE